MASPHRTYSELIFAHNAPRLRQAGFAVLPANGKKPRRTGYRKWRHAPDLSVVSMWAEQDPSADIVYVPGLSRARGGDHGIVVIDGDDEEACAQIVEVFGDTPGKVKTRRGYHGLYRATGLDLGKLTSLKKFGINADIKHGNSIVVAPPSRHQDNRGFAYAWDGCDETVIRDLPPFNVQALQQLLGKAAAQDVKPQMGLRDGSRKLWLNDLLCSHAMHCDTELELLDVARTANMDLPRRGHAMLEDAVVVERTAVVWRDAQEGKLKAWRGRSGNARACGSELDELCRLSQRNGPDAFALLIRLRLTHSAACRRGETFCITPKAMAKAGVIPGWTRERYETARDLLLLSGLVEKVADLKVTPKSRIGAQYSLVDCQ